MKNQALKNPHRVYSTVSTCLKGYSFQSESGIFNNSVPASCPSYQNDSCIVSKF